MDREKDLFHEIACTAYDLYEKRGRQHGYALQDWLEAERIVMEGHAAGIEKEAEIITAGRKKKAPAEAKTGTAKTARSTKPKATAATAKKKRTAAKKKPE